MSEEKGEIVETKSPVCRFALPLGCRAGGCIGSIWKELQKSISFYFSLIILLFFEFSSVIYIPSLFVKAPFSMSLRYLQLVIFLFTLFSPLSLFLFSFSILFSSFPHTLKNLPLILSVSFLHLPFPSPSPSSRRY